MTNNKLKAERDQAIRNTAAATMIMAAIIRKYGHNGRVLIEDTELDALPTGTVLERTGATGPGGVKGTFYKVVMPKPPEPLRIVSVDGVAVDQKAGNHENEK